MYKHTNLAKVSLGNKVRISLDQKVDLPTKFYELGLYPGAWIEVQRKAPAHGPLSCRILESDQIIVIRQAEAKVIYIDTE